MANATGTGLWTVPEARTYMGMDPDVVPDKPAAPAPVQVVEEPEEPDEQEEPDIPATEEEQSA